MFAESLVIVKTMQRSTSACSESVGRSKLSDLGLSQNEVGSDEVHEPQCLLVSSSG